MASLDLTSLAKARGAARVIATDVNPYRLRAAERFGADFVLNAETDVRAGVLQCNEERLADVVIVCTGAASAIEQALQSVDMGGTVLFFAPTLPDVKTHIHVDELWLNEI